ncbi:hypothetical protein NGA_0607420 [Nannochloropsis gaditana CCMP526]|uniref:uncharacterized protein n=1 Tax=Nannochloropsis gaditana (strain CCMP526) TaxID=1093141 RepID=UPI00029F7F63|nr:hypothetical protein NGA_0607420 [Nannochloropsis gaditana CCMP526]EKU22144.1 hypothetical protein NGA_0607420 [Nannochloropsis gaditana CCMP526]|eukprot:XP_005854219.1 hypothetical protein NGA_0607420 [Nannochloropsis gaditana CCMP526]
MVMPSIVMKYFTLFIVFAASARADCPPDGALQVAVSTSKTRVRRGGVTMFTLTLQQVTDWGNATAIYPAPSHPHLLIPPSPLLLSLRSMGKKRPSASAPEHAFRFDVVVGKTLEEDHLEFDLVILDGLDGNICFGPEHVEIDVYGRIRPERDH